jgi:hypothetical protein
MEDGEAARVGERAGNGLHLIVGEMFSRPRHAQLDDNRRVLGAGKFHGAKQRMKIDNLEWTE